jgi:hypothetical protein
MRTGAPVLGFRQPAPPLTSETIPNPASSPEQTSELPGLGQDSAHDEPHDEQSESRDGTPSKGSSRVTNPLNGDGLRDTFRGGVLIAGDTAHRVLARTPGQQEAGLYATDEADAEAIGDPLARIAQRHEGIGEVSPDTADLLAAMMGLTRYASKQIAKSQQARALDARVNLGAEVGDEGAAA